MPATQMPLLKKILPLIGWIALYLLWLVIFHNREFAVATTATIQFCYLVFVGAGYYFVVRFAAPRFLYTRQYLTFLLLYLAVIIAASVLRVPVALFLNGHYFNPGKPAPGYLHVFGTSFVNIFVWVSILVAARIAADQYRTQMRLEALALQKEQAELDFLNAQFNPHFLFNSIHTIYGSIDRQNTAARQMLLTFSDMLRYQLYDCNQGAIAVEKEVAYIRNYAALQNARKEGLELTLDVGHDVSGFMVAPLIFIAFIENSFKYAAINESGQHFITIRIFTRAGWLVFSCINSKETCVSENPLEQKGIGLSNARRRLELLYSGRHELVVQSELETFSVHLKLQLR